jgi:hypothetical protein
MQSAAQQGAIMKDLGMNIGTILRLLMLKKQGGDDEGDDGGWSGGGTDSPWPAIYNPEHPTNA